jgi:protein-tyrosine phosphatase
MFDFIEEAISRGESVLIHCLAGAHRAGTTGVSCLIHFAHLPAKDAIVIAKRCRPIIDSIGHLTEFLHRLEHAEEAQIVRK